MNANRLFNHLLEEYAFRVADEMIQLADSRNQSALIGLINGIDLSSSEEIVDRPVEEDNRPADCSPVLERQLSHIPTNSLAKQYGNVPGSPLLQEISSGGNEHIYRLIDLNLTQIDHTNSCIERLKDIVHRSEKNLSYETQKLPLIDHLRLLISKQELYVVELSNRNQRNYCRLEQ